MIGAGNRTRKKQSCLTGRSTCIECSIDECGQPGEIPCETPLECNASTLGKPSTDFARPKRSFAINPNHETRDSLGQIEAQAVDVGCVGRGGGKRKGLIEPAFRERAAQAVDRLEIGEISQIRKRKLDRLASDISLTGEALGMSLGPCVEIALGYRTQIEFDPYRLFSAERQSC